MVLGIQSLTGLSPTVVAIFSQSLLMVLCLPPALLCMACPRVPCWDQTCLLCTLSFCQMWFLSTIVTITNTLMTLSCPKVHHLISSLLFSPVFRHVLMMFCSEWIATSLSWTQIRLRLCQLALHLILSRSTVNNIGGNSVPFRTLVVFLSECGLNTLESILIEHCPCSSTSAAFAMHPP